MFIAIFVLIITGIYLVAVTHKIPYGGYWSIIIAAFVFDDYGFMA